MDHYLTTGQVAQQLRTSSQTIRNYCESGVIKATRSAGGHYRIEPGELERLKNLESLPPVARATLTGDSARPAAKRNPNELLAEPSIDAIDAAEQAYQSERNLAADTHQLARLRVRREATELEDWFQDRRQAQLDRQFEEERRQEEEYKQKILQRQAQAAAAARREFEKRWLEWAFSRKPWDGPADYSLLVKPHVMAALTEIEPDENHYTIETQIDAAISRALEPWRRTEQRRKAIEDAVQALPISMRWNHDYDWEARARIVASEAVALVREDASPKELEAIAEEAVNPLIRRHERAEWIEAQVRHLTLANDTMDDDADAREAVREALSSLPINASRQQLEQAKDSALGPIRDRIAMRVLKSRIDSWVPAELPNAEKTTAISTATEAVVALPAGTSSDELEKTAREAIDRQTAKSRLIEQGLREVPRHARRMLREYEYGRNETAGDIEQRVKGEVEKRLRQKLDGTETLDDVLDLVDDLMEAAEVCD
jgi:excisionase family DNA binding protein